LRIFFCKKMNRTEGSKIWGSHSSVLKIEVFFMCCCVIALAFHDILKDRNVFLFGVKHSNTKAVWSLGTWHTAHTTAQHHFPEHLHLHKRRNLGECIWDGES
jgi:hypothetical protein